MSDRLTPEERAEIRERLTRLTAEGAQSRSIEDGLRLLDDLDAVEGERDALAEEIAARDEAVRADERARVSVVHSTLTDADLVGELVRRGVLAGGVPDDVPWWKRRRYVTTWEDATDA